MSALTLLAAVLGLVASLYAARFLLLAYAKRNPYFHLADYMERFWVRRHNEAKTNHAARVHNIKRSDHDRALHDHPWANCSVVLLGGYWEIFPGALQSALEADSVAQSPQLSDLQSTITHLPGNRVPRAQRAAFAEAGVHWRGTGAVVRRRAETLHRLVVPADTSAWSLFLMGPKTKEWGFLTPKGWVHHVEYLKRLGREA